MNSTPQTRLVANAAISCRDAIEDMGKSPSLQESFRGFGSAVLLTVLWAAICVISNPAIAVIDCLPAACVLVYAVLLVLRYPWHAPAASFLASLFPILLHILALPPSTELELRLMTMLGVAAAIAGLWTAALCALSWQAEGPRRRLYALAGKSYLAEKARQFVGLELLLTMAALEGYAVIFLFAPYALTMLASLVGSAPVDAHLFAAAATIAC